MSARNDASIRLTLNADAAISKANQLKSGMQQIGTSATNAGTKTGTATKTMNSGLVTVNNSARMTGTSFTNVGTQASAMGVKGNTATKQIITGMNSATIATRGLGTAASTTATQMSTMGTRGVTATSNLTASTNASSGAMGMGKGGLGGNTMMAAAAVAGLAASVTQLATSFSNLTKFEIKHRNAQLGIAKAQDTLDATLVASAQYQARLNKMVEDGITSGDKYNYILGQSEVYLNKVNTQTTNLEIKTAKAKLATEELGDAQANFNTGVLTSSINIGIMSGLLVTNILALKGQAGGALISSGAVKTLSLSMKGLAASMWLVAKHPVFLIATAAFIAWELALSGVVEKMMGLDTGSLSVIKNVEKLFNSMGETAFEVEVLSDSTEKAAESQNILADAMNDTESAADKAASGLDNLGASVVEQTRNNDKLTESIKKSNDELDRFKKKRKFDYAKLGAKYNNMAAGSMSQHGNLYQQGSQMGNVYTNNKVGGSWTPLDQLAKNSRMAANMTAHKSRQRARLDEKDRLTNAFRNAGVTTGLSDGSFIRTIRGHLTNKRTRNDKARGFAGGDELQGSFMQGGRDAWAKYQSGISSKVAADVRGGGTWGKYGSLEKALRRERMTYQQDIKKLVKQMIIQQLKDKENNDAEIDRLRLLDGSKAKEYYNKVGTHEAYDVYDRMNYRQFRTDMQGGACVNT